MFYSLRSVRRLRRYREIASAFTRNGFGFVFDHLGGERWPPPRTLRLPAQEGLLTLPEDLAAGLTQVLDDGTNTYLYGNARIGEAQPEGWQHHLGDALGSVRELADSTGTVSLARSFEPFGSVLSSVGSASAVFSFTGEQLDGTGLTYLGARYLFNATGRFTTRDAIRWEANPFLYAAANPVVKADRTGLMSGPEAFARCFDIHSVSHGALSGETAQEAVDICRLAYSRDAWRTVDFGDTLSTAWGLLGAYINESSPESRLIFTSKDALTQELTRSDPLRQFRPEYLLERDTPGAREYFYDAAGQVDCLAEFISD